MFERFGNVVLPEVNGYRRKIVVGTLVQGVIADAAFRVARDTVALTFGVLRAVHEEAFFNRAEIAACLDDFFHEQNGALFQFAHALTERPVAPDVKHRADSVKSR